MASLPAAYHDLLQAPALASRATLDPDSAPQVSAVWFLWDGTALLFALNKQRPKYRNLVRDPRVAVAIGDPANPIAPWNCAGPSSVSRQIAITSSLLRPRASTCRATRRRPRGGGPRIGW